MKRIVHCTYHGCGALAENPDVDEPLCATHSRLMRKAAVVKPPKEKKEINKRSNKLTDIMQLYNQDREAFIRGKPCAKFPDEPATQVHHMMGKIGYADQWARENGIHLWLDKRFWLPVSQRGHDWIENHPEQAKEEGLSLNRLQNYGEKFSD